MKLSTTRLFPLGLMLALALLTFYLERTVREEEGHPALRRHDPDYIVTNFTTTTYDKTGAVESRLSATRMLHYPDDDSTELVSPRLVQSKTAKPRITVTAERGALSREGDEVFLYDNVVMVRDPEGGRPSAQLTTSFLHIVQPSSLVRTDRDVVLVEDRRRLTGRGMEYHYESRQFQLRENVRGRFEPKTDAKAEVKK
jgi:lipopolysaccharide export system protein LptC